jgi:transposase
VRVAILVRDRGSAVSRLEPPLEPPLEPERLVRRIEVITGGDGRRRWTLDEKARIVAETLDPGAVVSVIARRYGLTPQQLFAWRREARKRTAPGTDLLPGFVPAVVDLAELPTATRSRRRTAAAAIELEIAGVTMRVGHGAHASTVTAVIRALKKFT